ncbi:hypothetical protein FB451DRAFT_1192431 [Mycena latifolia]|nr:hypothetical protein FB451DRAFT_1192431 [Mycena latifolia]
MLQAAAVSLFDEHLTRAKQEGPTYLAAQSASPREFVQRFSRRVAQSISEGSSLDNGAPVHLLRDLYNFLDAPASLCGVRLSPASEEINGRRRDGGTTPPGGIPWYGLFTHERATQEVSAQLMCEDGDTRSKEDSARRDPETTQPIPIQTQNLAREESKDIAFRRAVRQVSEIRQERYPGYVSSRQQGVGSIRDNVREGETRRRGTGIVARAGERAGSEVETAYGMQRGAGKTESRRCAAWRTKTADEMEMRNARDGVRASAMADWHAARSTLAATPPIPTPSGRAALLGVDGGGEELAGAVVEAAVLEADPDTEDAEAEAEVDDGTSDGKERDVGLVAAAQNCSTSASAEDTSAGHAVGRRGGWRRRSFRCGQRVKGSGEEGNAQWGNGEAVHGDLGGAARGGRGEAQARGEDEDSAPHDETPRQKGSEEGSEATARTIEPDNQAARKRRISFTPPLREIMSQAACAAQRHAMAPARLLETLSIHPMCGDLESAGMNGVCSGRVRRRHRHFRPPAFTDERIPGQYPAYKQNLMFGPRVYARKSSTSIAPTQNRREGRWKLDGARGQGPWENREVEQAGGRRGRVASKMCKTCSEGVEASAIAGGHFRPEMRRGDAIRRASGMISARDTEPPDYVAQAPEKKDSAKLLGTNAAPSSKDKFWTLGAKRQVLSPRDKSGDTWRAGPQRSEEGLVQDSLTRHRAIHIQTKGEAKVPLVAARSKVEGAPAVRACPEASARTHAFLFLVTVYSRGVCPARKASAGPTDEGLGRGRAMEPRWRANTQTRGARRELVPPFAHTARFCGRLNGRTCRRQLDFHGTRDRMGYTGKYSSWQIQPWMEPELKPRKFVSGPARLRGVRSLALTKWLRSRVLFLFRRVANGTAATPCPQRHLQRMPQCALTGTPREVHDGAPGVEHEPEPEAGRGGGGAEDDREKIDVRMRAALKKSVGRGTRGVQAALRGRNLKTSPERQGERVRSRNPEPLAVETAGEIGLVAG